RRSAEAALTGSDISLRRGLKQLAGAISGGEQQMLAVGRGLVLKPRLSRRNDAPAANEYALLIDVNVVIADHLAPARDLAPE
ncbi:MAG: hypothetical protein ABSC37_11620, partial [Xanthobacteraceae bacterium]